MKITLINVTIIFLVSFFQLTVAQEYPAPPADFEWVEAPEIKGAFLKPNNWHYKKRKEKNVQSYYITKENIDTEGKYLTGFSVIVIKNIPEKMNITTTQFAKSYLSQAVINRKIIKNPWRHGNGAFDSYGVVIRNPDPQEGDYNTHNLVICNDQTGTVYTIVYEAPTEYWETSWEIGEVILSKLMISSDI